MLYIHTTRVYPECLYVCLYVCAPKLVCMYVYIRYAHINRMYSGTHVCIPLFCTEFCNLFFSVGEEARVSSKTQNSVFAAFCRDVSLLLNNHLFVCFLQATRYTTRQSGLIRSKPSVPCLPDIRRWQVGVLAAWNSAYHRPHSSTLSLSTTLSPPCPLTYVPHRAKPHPPRVVFSHPYLTAVSVVDGNSLLSTRRQKRRAV